MKKFFQSGLSSTFSVLISVHPKKKEASSSIFCRLVHVFIKRCRISYPLLMRITSYPKSWIMRTSRTINTCRLYGIQPQMPVVRPLRDMWVQLHKKIEAKGTKARAYIQLLHAYWQSSCGIWHQCASAMQARSTHNRFAHYSPKLWQGFQVARERQNQYKCYVQPYDWYKHSANTCKVNFWGLSTCIPAAIGYTHRWQALSQTTEVTTPKVIIHKR